MKIIFIIISLIICVNATSKGKAIILASKTIDGEIIVLAKYQGKVIEGIVKRASKKGFLAIDWKYIKYEDHKEELKNNPRSSVRTKNIRSKIGKKVLVIGDIPIEDKKAQKLITNQEYEKGTSKVASVETSNQSPEIVVTGDSEGFYSRFFKRRDDLPISATTPSTPTVTIPKKEIPLPPCEPYTDIKQEKIYNQARGKGDTICKISTILYELKRVYNKCSDFIDLGKKTSFKRYRLSYKPKDSKEVILSECHTDEADTHYKILDDYASCGFNHDYVKGISRKSKKLYYLGNDNKRIDISECSNETKEYKHQHTFDGCAVQYVGQSAILSKRKFIDVDGKIEYIGECVAESTSVPLVEEICSDRFTHKYNEGKSYYNKRTYYLDNFGVKNYINSCQASTDYVVHSSVTTGCAISNNDATKSFNRQSKIFVTDKHDASKSIMIRDCTATSISEPYSVVGQTWSRGGYSNQPIVINNLRNGQFVSYFRKFYSAWYENIFDASTYNFHAGCYNYGIAHNWRTTSGVQIDAGLSDQFPTWTGSYREVVDKVTHAPVWQISYYYVCGNARCNLSHFYSYNKYKRGDGSIYTDSSASGVKYVCGTGSKL